MTRKITKDDKAAVYKWSSHNESRHNTIIWAALLSPAQLWLGVTVCTVVGIWVHVEWFLLVLLPLTHQHGPIVPVQWMYSRNMGPC